LSSSRLGSSRGLATSPILRPRQFVSTSNKSIEAQRAARGGSFDQEFSDEVVSGGVLAADRLGFTAMLASVRIGDTVHIYAVDRLGCDALDVQATVRGCWRQE
jgi:putative DNA-invertase from lambdoid prophage Rac